MTRLAQLSSAQRAELCLRLGQESHYSARRLAGLMGISLRHLERYFEADFGRPPQHWLNEQRMIAAQPLLVAGRQIKRVANELGFKQTSHFCRQFKDHYGLTPTQLVGKYLAASPLADLALGPRAPGGRLVPTHD